jgi:sRNA-binding carbon storage regulator CsrA
MSKILITIGLLIIGYALSPFGLKTITTDPIETDPSLRIGLGANNTLAISRTEVNQAIDYAQEIEKAQNTKAIDQQRWSDRLLGLVMILSGLVSIAAGYQRILSAKKKPDFIVVAAIAVLSSAVAISTAAAGRIENMAKGRINCIDGLGSEIRSTLADVKGTSDEDEARRYLEELKLAADRCDR